MTLVLRNKAMGNIRIYDITSLVNFRKLKPAFERLEPDRNNLYSNSDNTHKHILHLNHYITDEGRLFVRQDNQHLLDSKTKRKLKYPLINPSANPFVVNRILEIYSELVEQKHASHIIVEMQRTYASSLDINPVEWKTPACKHMGILCIDRENITGGIDQFKTTSVTTYSELDHELAPGYLLVLEPHLLFHKESPIESHILNEPGYKDILKITSDPKLI